MYIHVFRSRYKLYTKFFSLLNQYNSNYIRKSSLYKLKVLNKISNLKRFFFYRNKNFNG